MKIEIWSDVMCPFCYIGKKRFENALSQFPQKNEIKIIWKSFQLDPDIKKETGLSSAEYLAKRKGMSVQQVTQMQDNVTKMAAESGLAFHFEKSIVANSFNAHRISHLALKHRVQDRTEELLFAGHFTEGKDIDDAATLIEIAKQAGITGDEAKKTLDADAFKTEVENDINEARELGISGVPFFVFNRKYAISGAQDSKVFLEALTKSFSEWEKEQLSNPETI